MAIVDIQKLTAIEDLLVSGAGDQLIPWFPRRISSMKDDGKTYLLMGGDSPGGLGIATLAKNGQLDFIDAYGTSFSQLDAQSLFGQGIAIHKIGGANFAYSIGLATHDTLGRAYSVSVLNFDDPGKPTLVQKFTDSEAIGEFGINGGTDPIVASKDGRDFLIFSSGRSSEFHSYRIRDDGTLGQLKVSQASERLSDGFTEAQIGNKTFVVSFGGYDTAPMQVLKLNKKGILKPVYDLSPDEPAIFNQQTKGIVSANINGQTFVFASEVTRGAILAFKMKSSGELQLVDKIFPGSGDQWGSPEGLETFDHNGQTYILSGGYGRSIAIFKVSDGGTLIEVDEFEMQHPHLGRVADIEVVQFGSSTYFTASTLSSAPLTSYRFVPTDTPITGGKNANKITGTDEDDQILSRNGNDRVFGALGDDLIEGGNGNDRLLGQEGHDDLFGGEGRDTLLGGSGDDFMFGEAGNDLLKGVDGHDYIVGGNGRDRVFGNNGNDRLFGGAGIDILKGGDGNDRISDGSGKGDRLTGGDGADIFIFEDDGQRDVITDYEDGLDIIDLRAEGPLIYADLKIRESGEGLVIRYGNDVIDLKARDGKIFQHELTDSDFLFT